MRANNWILLVLSIVVTVLAAVLWARGLASWLEAVGCVTGAVCVWLTVKENVLNFPIGLANVTALVVVSFRAGLYANAGLQVVYFLLGVIGWYLWLYGGERGTALKIVRASAVEKTGIMAAVVALTLVLWFVLNRVGGSATFWDALTTAISLGAQWLLNRKRLESWILWIVVDIILVPVYLYQNLYLTAVLYAVFLVMAIMGLMQWTATWRKQQAERGVELAEVAV
jgi:nicotinamide mononucleotide transporter